MSTFLGVDSGFLQRMSYGQVPYFYDLNSLAAAQAKIGAINSTGISKVTSQHVATSGAIVIK